MMADGTKQAGLILIGLASIFLVGRSEVAKFERRAASEIKTTLGGGDVSVKTRANGAFGYLEGDLSRVEIRASKFSTAALPFFTEPERSKSGRAKWLGLRLSDFDLAGLRVERLDADIPDCRYDLGLARSKGNIRLSQSGEGRGRVVVSQESLEAFVMAKYPAIQNFKLQLADGRAKVGGFVDLPLIRASFVASARLASADGRRLDLVDAQIAFDGQPAQPMAGEALMRSINPVVDLDRDLRLYGALDVEQIVLADGSLEAKGKARIPVRPESNLGVRQLPAALGT